MDNPERWMDDPSGYDSQVKRCQVGMTHPRSGVVEQCTLPADHQENDSDHVDRHGCKAKVLVTQATIREVRALQEYDDEQRRQRDVLVMGGRGVHGARPDEPTTTCDMGIGYCYVCGWAITLVPGGNGPTWVHDATKTVSGSGSGPVR